MPTPWLLLFAARLLSACAAPDTVWNPSDGFALDRGQAVSPWEAEEPAQADLDAGAVAQRDAQADGAGAGDAESSVASCEFAVTTLPAGGRYSPKNVGAIWIEDAQGAWVKTLAIWAGVRARYLTDLRAADPSRSRVDAVTSATLREHERHVVTWDLTDAAGDVVPDGSYALRVEFTERDGSGPTMSAGFETGAEPFVSEPADHEHFVDIELRCGS